MSATITEAGARLGKIVNVEVVQVGTVLTLAADEGDAVVYVDDASPFEEEGGQVTIGGQQYAYTGVDFEAGGIFLTGALEDPGAEGDPVLAFPDAFEKIAYVSLGEDGDAISAQVPHDLDAFVDEGVRDPANQETVQIEDRGSYDWTVIDVIGRQANFTPTVIEDIGSDGDAPTSSPAATVLGGLGALFVRWTPVSNHDFVTYQVHVSTSAGFTPDGTTLAATTSASSVTLKALPDGTPMAYDVPYYVQIIATDDDGAAAPGTEGSGSVFKATTGDIASDYVYAGTLVADQITGGTIQSDVLLSGTIRTATDGSRVELGAFGITVYDSTGTPTTLLGSNSTSTFKGIVEADTLTVLNGATLRGALNELSRGGLLTLASGTTSPGNAPTVVVDYETLPLKNADGTSVTTTPMGLGYNGGAFYTHLSNGFTQRFNPTTGLFTGSVGLTTTTKANYAWPDFNGPGYYFTTDGVLTRDVDRYNSVYRYQINEDWAGGPGSWVRSGDVTFPTGKVLVGLDAQSSVAQVYKSGFPMQGHYFQADMATPDGQQFGVLTGLRVSLDASNYAFLGFSVRSADGVRLVSWRVVVGGSLVGQGSIPYDDGGDHTSFKIAETAGIFVFYTGDAAGVFTQVGAVNHTFTASQLASVSLGLFATNNNAPGMVQNGDFDSNIDHWSAGRANLFQNLSVKRSGAGSLMMQRSSAVSTSMYAAAADAATGEINGTFRINENTTYTATAWVRAATVARLVSIRIAWLDSSGTALSPYTNSATGLDSTSAWTQFTASGMAPVGAQYARIDVIVNVTEANAGENHYVDDVSCAFDEIEVTSDNWKSGWASFYAGLARLNTTQVPALGTDGTNLLVAEVNPAGNIVIRTVDADDMKTVLATTTSASTGFTGPLTAVMVGTFDLGATRFVVKGSGSAPFYVFDAAGTRYVNDEFPADGGGSQGATWDGATFVAVGAGPAPRLFKRSGIKWNDAGPTKVFTTAYTWYDGDATGGTHETAVSPVGSFTMQKRARFTVTSAAIPDNGGTDDPDRIRVYAAQGSGTLYLQGTTAAGVQSLLVTALSTTGTAPSSSNFPGATPAQITSGDGTSLVISGNGFVKGNLSPVALSLGSGNLNAQTTQGHFVQSSDAAATLANNYPVTFAGFLEVGGASSATLWQRYTLYRQNGTRSFVRQLQGGTWGAWVEFAPVVAAKPRATAVIGTSPQVVTTTNVDVDGMTVTLVLPVAGDVLVSAVLDVATYGTATGANFLGRLLADGSANAILAVHNNGSASTSLRLPVSQQWLYLALAAGSHTFTVQASAATASVYRIGAHSSLTAFMV